jgi:hypothetical protein
MTEEMENQEISEPETVEDTGSEQEEQPRRPLLSTDGVTKKDIDSLFRKIEKIEKMVKRETPAVTPRVEVAESQDSGLDRILEVKEATEGLDNREVQALRLMSKAGKVSLSEARKSEDFAIWQEGYKQKVGKENVKNNIPAPSTTQSTSEVKKALAQMNREERQKLWVELGYKKS